MDTGGDENCGDVVIGGGGTTTMKTGVKIWTLRVRTTTLN